MESNKRKWSLRRYRKQSTQSDASAKYQEYAISFIIGIVTGFILQAWIFPFLFDPHPNVNLILDNKTDDYLVLVKNESDSQYKLRLNTDTPIEDLSLFFLMPGVIKNNKEYNSNTDCNYGKSEQGFIQNGRGYQLKGQDQISIQCQKMGSDSHYYLYFDLNEENYTPIIIYSPNGTPFKVPAFFTVACSYYYKGVNDRIIRNNCNINLTFI
jgi:hypothetical protein